MCREDLVPLPYVPPYWTPYHMGLVSMVEQRKKSGSSAWRHQHVYSMYINVHILFQEWIWCSTVKPEEGGTKQDWHPRAVSMPPTLLGSLHSCASIEVSWIQAPRRCAKSIENPFFLSLAERLTSYLTVQTTFTMYDIYIYIFPRCSKKNIITRTHSKTHNEIQTMRKTPLNTWVGPCALSGDTPNMHFWWIFYFSFCVCWEA